MKTNTLNFDIFSQAGPARTSVHVLVLDGAIVGRIVTAWPKDGAGIVKLAVMAWRGPWAELPVMRGRARGYGYDRESAAFQDALTRHGVQCPDLGGRGMGTVRDWLGSIGYQCEQVL